MPQTKPVARPESFHTFGDLLVYLRKRARMTQEELGRAVGYSRTQITLLEKNQRLPSITTVRALFVNALHLEESPEFAQRLIDLATERRKPRTNLPASVNALIGRERASAEVRDLLQRPDTRLVTLIGPPGIGKTRLSLQVASELLPDFADGVFFVPVALVTDPNLVAPVIMQTLGMAQTEQRSPLEQLKENIGSRQELIVLDNFEQIVKAAAVVSELLAGCPRLKIIITSREALRITWEWLYPVPALSSPDEEQVQNIAALEFDQFSALRLFTERAKAFRYDFVLTVENIPAVAAICRQLDGLPLAIELIASRIRFMSPQALLPHLTNNFTLHVDGMRNVPDRQRTMHNAINWSYALLSQGEQTLLRRLAVFSGGWTLRAAEEVCTVNGIEADGVESLLLSLMDKSLLIADTSAEELRFSMLETIRQFAHEKLTEAGEDERLKTAHLDYYLQFAETAKQNLYGAAQAIWLRRLDIEYPNLRAALLWAETSHKVETGMRIAIALGYFWYIRLYMNDGCMYLERALAVYTAHEGNQPLIRAKVLLWLSEMERLRNNIPAAWGYADETRNMLKGLNDRAGLAEVLRVMSGIALAERHYPEARQLLEESLGLLKTMNNPHSQAWVLNGLGEVARAQNDFGLAESLYGKALDLFRIAGDEFRISTVLQNLGFVALQQGKYGLAQDWLRESLRISRKLEDPGNTEGCLIGLAGLIGIKGDFACAVRVLSAVDTAVMVYGGQLDSPDQMVFVRTMEELKMRLDSAAFAAARAEGRQLTIEQAVELAYAGLR